MEYQILYLDERLRECKFSQTSGMAIRIKQVCVDEYITRIEINVINKGAEKRLIPVFETVVQGKTDFYMIPCVNYNGNEWGTGKEPKGTEKDGKPWIFSADRVGVPGCSVVENEEYCTGIFADNKGISKEASASLFKREGKIVQRIYFSHMEYP